MTKLPEYSSIISPGSITIVTPNGREFTWAKDHPRFSHVKDAVRGGASAEEIEVMKAAAKWGNVEIKGDTVYYKDKPIHNTLTERILQHLNEQLPVEPLLRFADNLFKNQRREAVESLYDFLEANKIPITPDGCFLVYKKVNDNYRDYYSGNFDNSIGKTCEVEPWEVEADREQTCSKGLHVCARHYLPSYYGGSGHVMICKVDPGHVVAVPRDYNNSKMRVFKYEVIGELNEEDKAEVFDRASYVAPGNEGALKGHATWSDDWLAGADDSEEEDGSDGGCYDYGFPD
jgi:hypothetical protein